MCHGSNTSDDTSNEIADAVIDNTTDDTACNIGDITGNNSCEDTDGYSENDIDGNTGGNTYSVTGAH